MKERLIYFIKELYNSNGKVSSKVYVGIRASTIHSIIILADVFLHLKVSSYLFWGNLSLIFACFGLATATAFKSMGIKADIASENPKEAQSILSSPNP